MNKSQYIQKALEISGLIDYDILKDVEFELEESSQSDLLDDVIERLEEIEDYLGFKKENNVKE